MVTYYAVRVGRSTGIFNQWKLCEASVIGYPKAVFKSFKTLPLAEAYLNETPSPVSIDTNRTVYYTDGGCRSTIAAWAYVRVDSLSRVISGRLPPPSTNNVAELTAIQQALRDSLETGCSQVEIRTDSQYSIGVLSGVTVARANLHLVDETRQLIDRLGSVQFTHVRGHAGDYYNSLCDAECTRLLTQNEPSVDGAN